MPFQNLSINHILLADDDEDDRVLFRDALKELVPDVRLTVVANGVELMQLLHEQPSSHPDLLFLDLNMPLKSGFECLHEIRKEDELQHIPVIVLSTSSMHDALSEMGNDRPDLYVRKPSTFSKLKTVIGRILGLDLNKVLALSTTKPLAIY